MFRYYKIAALYPALVSIMAILIISVILNRNYHSEWLTSDAVIWMSVLAGLVYAAIWCLLTLTILLVSVNWVLHSKLWTFLCWFLVPGIPLVWAFVIAARNMLARQGEMRGDLWYPISFLLPYAIGLVWSYVAFRREHYDELE